MTQPNGDTDNRYKDGISLKAYVDTRFTSVEDKIDSLEKLLTTMVAQIVDNTALARQSMETRMEGVNEWRQTYADMQHNYLLQSEGMAQFATIIEKIDDQGKLIGKLQLSEANLAGKASQKAVYIALGLTVLSAATAIVAVIIAIAH